MNNAFNTAHRYPGRAGPILHFVGGWGLGQGLYLLSLWTCLTVTNLHLIHWPMAWADVNNTHIPHSRLPSNRSHLLLLLYTAGITWRRKITVLARGWGTWFYELCEIVMIVVRTGGILWCVLEEDRAVYWIKKIIVTTGRGRLWCVLEVEDRVVCWRKTIKVSFNYWVTLNLQILVPALICLRKSDLISCLKYCWLPFRVNCFSFLSFVV
jgi:hypothetical protein